MGAAVGFAADECPCVGTELVPSDGRCILDFLSGILRSQRRHWPLPRTFCTYIDIQHAGGRDAGFLTQVCGNNFIVFKVEPPPIVTDAQLDAFVLAVRDIVELGSFVGIILVRSPRSGVAGDSQLDSYPFNSPSF